MGSPFYRVLALLARIVLSKAQLNAFEPDFQEDKSKQGEPPHMPTDQNVDTVKRTVPLRRQPSMQQAEAPHMPMDLNVAEVKRMGSLRAWIAFQISRLRNAEVPDKDVRGEDLILSKGFSSRDAIVYGEDGTLGGKLIFVMSQNGSVFLEEIIPGDKRLIDDLKVSVQRVTDHMAAQYRSRVEADPALAHLRFQFLDQVLYKVTVDDTDGIPVFHPISETDMPLKPSDPGFEEDKFARLIVGAFRNSTVGAQNRVHTYYPSNLVTLFRRRRRPDPIVYPFRAAVWLNARSDDVPVPLSSFFLIVFFFLGAVIPFCILVIPRQDVWDRFERSMYLSAYFLTALSVRELLASKGSSAANVLRGFIQPSTLKQMANALCISVPQLLTLARRGGSWTENLDYTQLCFLGRSRAGHVKRDHWGKMYKYAVGFESFNKQFALTESGIRTITGFPGQEGGHCARNVEEIGPVSDFIEFDETEHYLA